MSTVQILHDEIQSFDPEAAERFQAEMVAAMMDAPLKNFTSLRGVTSAWTDKRDHLKKMATDPAYRAMVVGDIKERYGVELPDDAPDATEAVLSVSAPVGDDEDAEQKDPSFV